MWEITVGRDAASILRPAPADETGDARCLRAPPGPSTVTSPVPEAPTPPPTPETSKQKAPYAGYFVFMAFLYVVATFSTAANAVALSSSSLRSSCFMTSAAASCDN